MRNWIYRFIRNTLLILCRKQGFKTIISSVSYELENQNKRKPNAVVLERYLNPEIGGYAHAAPLTGRDLDTLRFSLVKDYIIENRMSAVEIGCAGGDLLGQLATELPDKNYTGIDFNVDFAKQNFKIKHDKPLTNLEFISGYFLETELPKSDAAILVSTASCFLPLELSATFEKIKNSEIKTIIISEPWWWRQPLSASDTSTNSTHAKYVCWNHAYPGLLKKAGYSITHFEKTVEKSNAERLFIVATQAS
ncbi:MAG: methyltransferase [Alphaproteobacteria bacterium]